ncbi:carboxypeptidase 4 [Mycena vulgaris]|nr:carboxypeptidase 4 [Mycena vulgaris]
MIISKFQAARDSGTQTRGRKRDLTNPVASASRRGPPELLKDETDVTPEFLGFWKNFMKAFEPQSRKVIVAGESYAGSYIPYIADAMLNANDTRFFDVDATFIVDPIIGNRNAHQQGKLELPTSIRSHQDGHQFLTRRGPENLFPFNDTFEEQLATLDETCGFTAFLDEYLVFPSKGVQPPAPASDGECDMFNTLTDAMYFINPCFQTYRITTTCPYAMGPVMNRPATAWSRNKRAVGRVALLPRRYVLPRVIARFNKTLIVSGNLDLTLPTNGTLYAGDPNMTWNGAFFVPYTAAATGGEPPDGQVWSLAGTGLMGTLHEECGLTFVDVFFAGHQLPQWQPAAAFRQLEFVLGRVESMTGTEEWTVTT